MIIEDGFNEYFETIYGEEKDYESIKQEFKELYYAGYRDCLNHTAKLFNNNESFSEYLNSATEELIAFAEIVVERCRERRGELDKLNER